VANKITDAPTLCNSSEFRQQVTNHLIYNNFYPLSFSPKGEMILNLLPPWGKAGMGVFARIDNASFDPV
jgi:hypothetical protein